MSRPLSMTDTAAEVGCHYDTFRKNWRDWIEHLGFPSPIHGHKWDREAVAAWKIRRSSLRVVTEIRAAPEPEARAANTRVQRDREALQQMRAAR